MYMYIYIDIDITCVQNGLSPHPRCHSGSVFRSSSLARWATPDDLAMLEDGEQISK